MRGWTIVVYAAGDLGGSMGLDIHLLKLFGNT